MLHFDHRQRQQRKLQWSAYHNFLLVLLGCAVTLLFLFLSVYAPAHLDRLLVGLLYAGIGVLSVLALTVGIALGVRIRRTHHRWRWLSHPPARVHDVPLHIVPTSSRVPDTLRPYPPDQFFSFDPLNKRPPEHLNPDQGNRF